MLSFFSLVLGLAGACEGKCQQSRSDVSETCSCAQHTSWNVCVERRSVVARHSFEMAMMLFFYRCGLRQSLAFCQVLRELLNSCEL